MVSFRQLHSHLKRISQNDLPGSQKESGFKRAFATLSGQDTGTFTGTMFLNVEQLEKQLDKEDFQEIGSMAAFNILETQFQMFITNQDYLDDEYVAMTHNYFIQYTRQAIPEFRDILIQHLESIKKSIDERVQLKREYDSWSQFLKEKSNEAEVKHDTDVIETINIELEHKVAKLLKENETLKKNYKELFDSIKITRAKAIEHTTSLTATNDKFKAQLQEKGFAIATLKNELRKSTGNSMNTKFSKSSILGKPMSQPLRNHSVVRQLTAFKSERPRISKPQRDPQVDVNYDLISSKNMKRFSSNDMVHNHYLEEAKKRTQERSRNSEPSLMPLLDHKAQLMVAIQCLEEILKHLGIGMQLRIVLSRQRISELGLHDHNNEQSCSKLVPDVVSQAEKTATSRQVLELLFHHHITMLRKTTIIKDSYITTSVGITILPSHNNAEENNNNVRRLLLITLQASFPNDNRRSNPSTNIQSTSAPSTHTNVHAEENNNDQVAEGEQLQDDEFTNPFCASVQEEVESSSHNIGNSNVLTFNQPHVSEYRWMKDHPLKQVRENPSRPVQTRRQLATDPEM
nr:hypothetical protein [Tanacetum cinerariifolium]